MHVPCLLRVFSISQNFTLDGRSVAASCLRPTRSIISATPSAISFRHFERERRDTYQNWNTRPPTIKPKNMDSQQQYCILILGFTLTSSLPGLLHYLKRALKHQLLGTLLAVSLIPSYHITRRTPSANLQLIAHHSSLTHPSSSLRTMTS